MLIGDRTIETPVDDPFRFEPDWRASLASYMFDAGVCTKADIESIYNTGGVPEESGVDEPAPKTKGGKKGKKGKTPAKPKPKAKKTRGIPPFDESPEYRCLAIDQWVVKQVLFMHRKSTGAALNDEDRALMLAMKWFVEEGQGVTRTRLEPLLITSVSLKVIALDIAGNEDAEIAIKAYERMYFNCREDDGSLTKSTNLLQSMAMPNGELKMFYKKQEPKDENGEKLDKRSLATDADIWKAMAFSLGYDVLMRRWNWTDRAHGLTKEKNTCEYMMSVVWDLSISRLIESAYTGTISHEDLSRLLSAITSQSKFSLDAKNGSSGNTSDEATLALMAILQAAAPKMHQIVLGGAGSVDDDAIRSRIESQRAIDAQVIEDKGKDVSDALVKQQINAAIRGG